MEKCPNSNDRQIITIWPGSVNWNSQIANITCAFIRFSRRFRLVLTLLTRCKVAGCLVSFLDHMARAMQIIRGRTGAHLSRRKDSDVVEPDPQGPMGLLMTVNF